MISAYLNKYAVQLLMAAIIFLIAALSALGAVSEFRSTIKDAVEIAKSERDAYWTAEIEKANAVASANIIAQMKASKAAEDKAQAEITRLNNQITELENANAALSDTPGSGIDVNRSRLLNNQLIGGKSYPPY